MIVTNTGSRKWDEVVQLYVHQDYTSLKRPVEQLEGFKRITLNPGEKQMVIFPIGFDQVKFWKAAKWQMEPGKLTLLIGASSQDIRLTGSIDLK